MKAQRSKARVVLTTMRATLDLLERSYCVIHGHLHYRDFNISVDCETVGARPLRDGNED